MGKRRNTYKILVGNPVWRDHWEDIGVNSKMILEWILVKYGGIVWTGCIWLL
jgi:hypothetical protein